MFRKFETSQLASHNKAKSSVVRKTKAELSGCYPSMSEWLEYEVWPKKATEDHDNSMYLCNCKMGGTKLEFILDAKSKPLFMRIKSMSKGRIFPTLKTLHQFPDALPRFQVDKGAISHILRGSDVFCVGLTSSGGSIPINPDSEDGSWDKGTIVAIYAQGKRHACGIGSLARPSSEIGRKDVGINLIQYLGDDLWGCKSF